MFSITVAFPNSAFALLYRERESADRSWIRLTSESPAVVDDDFGQRFEVRREHTIALMFEDLDQTKLALAERALHNARAQVKANQLASADPSLRASNLVAGPAMISPMMRGNGR